MSKLDLLKFFEQVDGEVELAGFSPEELEEILGQLNGGEPLSKEDFKKKYFDYYDDVKDKTLKRQDW